MPRLSAAERTVVSRLTRDTCAKLRALEKVNAASLRAIRRELSSRIDDAPASVAVGLARLLADSGAPGSFPVMFEMVYYHPTALEALRIADLKRLGKKMSGWGDVDCLSYMAGVAWRNGQIEDSDVHEWAHSGNRWWRRAALVSTVPLNMKSQGGSGDPERTLAVCDLLIDDRDDMVVKAMSWALRALSTRERGMVERFVGQHEQRLAPRVVREVRNKLRTGRKDGRPGIRTHN